MADLFIMLKYDLFLKLFGTKVCRIVYACLWKKRFLLDKFWENIKKGGQLPSIARLKSVSMP